jgi:hypothetical protein
MKKKERTASKTQRPNQYMARNLGGQDLAEPGCLMTDEYVERCWWAHDTAGWVRSAMDSLERAADAAEGSNEKRRALEDAKERLLVFGCCINENDENDLADSLHMVANALEGKLRGAKNDERYLEAYFKAVSERSKGSPPLFSEVWDALTSLSGTSPVSTKRKDTKPLTPKPLTPKEKQDIRHFEALSYKHQQVEEAIGKRYKRTGGGDLVAINENGDARGQTPRLNEDALKDDLRRRLKILGCPVSPDKRGGWRQPKEQKSD